MSFYEDYVAEGLCCETCGTLIDETEPGFPRRCDHCKEEAPMSGQNGRVTGTVKWFSPEKGFGFITPDGGGKDAFVHHTAIQADGFRTLEEGERVEMTVVEGTKGPAAEEVVKL